MTNILIPTDFTFSSIRMAEQALEIIDVKKVNIIFFHLFDSPWSEFELLNSSRKKPYADVLTDKFRQQCKQLKDQHPDTVQKVCFKFLEGTGVGLFRNFVDANEIDLIFCPETYHYTAVNKMSADPRSLFQKSGVAIVREPNKKVKRVVVEEPQLIAPAMMPAIN